MEDSGKNAKTTAQRLVDGTIVVVIAVLFGLAVFSYMQPSRLEKTQGGAAPPFKLETASGDVVGPSTHEGKVILMDFWATWCKPCLKQMPVLAELEDDPNLAEDLRVLSINVDDPNNRREERVAHVLKRGGWDFDVLYDNGQVQTLYGVDTLPSLVIVAPDGTIHYAGSGVHSKERLVELIDEVRPHAEPSEAQDENAS